MGQDQRQPCQHERQTTFDGPFGANVAAHSAMATSRTICKDCLAHLKWENVPRTQGTGDHYDMVALLEKGPLGEWEKSFVASIKKQKSLSPKQRECFDRMVRKYVKPSEAPAPDPQPVMDEDLDRLPF